MLVVSLVLVAAGGIIEIIPTFLIEEQRADHHAA